MTLMSPDIDLALPEPVTASNAAVPGYALGTLIGAAVFHVFWLM